jgi:hypothetical protein
MQANCCQNAMDITATRIVEVLKRILPTIETNTRVMLIQDLSKINLQFLELIDYQLQEPPNPE